MFVNDWWSLGILHSAEWIWARPDDEEDVSPEHVICAKELGDVQLSNTFWATSSVNQLPFQREVHSIVIISRQTWEDHQHCVGGVSLFFLWLGFGSLFFFLGAVPMTMLALFLTWCMKMVREWLMKSESGIFNLLCWTSFTFQADSTLVRNVSTQQKKQNGSTTTTNLNGLKMTGNAGTFFSHHVL